MENYDVIIIGAGAAGLTAAIYARRANKSVLVLEDKTYGGQIVETLRIENYPALPHVSGAEFAKKLYEQAKELGAEVRFEKVEKLSVEEEGKIVTTDENKYLAKAVIIASGTSSRKMGLENEAILTGRGVSYCATCDGALYKNKRVIVYGGGNTALWDAYYLADIASEVIVVCRSKNFHADAALVEKVRSKKNVEFMMEAEIVRLGETEDKLKSVGVRFSDAGVREIETAALFVAIGRMPNTEEFKDVVELDESGYIVAGEDCHTSASGIFAAGDCRTKTLRQLVTATNDGAMAATEAVKHVALANRQS